MSGECLDFPHTPDSFSEVNFRVIDILCGVGGETYIYSGELFDWYVDELGELESIHLRNPYRRKIRDDFAAEPTNSRYKIPTRFLIVPYKSIININVRYFAVTLTINESEVEANEEAVEASEEDNEGQSAVA